VSIFFWIGVEINSLIRIKLKSKCNYENNLGIAYLHFAGPLYGVTIIVIIKQKSEQSGACAGKQNVRTCGGEGACQVTHFPVHNGWCSVPNIPAKIWTF